MTLITEDCCNVVKLGTYGHNELVTLPITACMVGMHKIVFSQSGLRREVNYYIKTIGDAFVLNMSLFPIGAETQFYIEKPCGTKHYEEEVELECETVSDGYYYFIVNSKVLKPKGANIIDVEDHSFDFLEQDNLTPLA
jgi:hypothetical protein